MRIQIRRLVMLSLCLAMAAHGGACLSPLPGIPCGDMWCPDGQKCGGPDVGLLQQACIAESVCGNGILDVGEECDCGSGPAILASSAFCAGQGNSKTSGFCSDECHPHCGDGIVEGDEVCDTKVPITPATSLTSTCVAHKYDFGRPGCATSCKAITWDSCGDWGWRPVDTGSDDNINAIWGSQSNDIWVSGDNETLHYDGTSWHPENELHFFDMWGSGPDDIFGLEIDGQLDRLGRVVWHYDGTSWMKAHSGNDRLITIWGIESPEGSRDVFVLTKTKVPDSSMAGAPEHFMILHCRTPSCMDTDMDTDWEEMPTPAIEQPRAIWGMSATDFFIVGDNGTIRHYHPSDSSDDVTWTDLSSDVSQLVAGDLSGIWGSANSDIYIIGAGAVLLHYDGSSWTKIDVNSHLSSIWGSSPNDIFTVGDGNLLHFDGRSWQQMQLYRTPFPSRIWGTGPRDIYAIRNANMMHYDGIDLQQMEYPVQDPPATAPALQNVWFTGKGKAYALGTDSSIVSYDGASWQLLPLPDQNQNQCLDMQGIVSLWECLGHVCLIDKKGAIAIYDPLFPMACLTPGPAVADRMVAVWLNGPQNLYSDIYAIGNKGAVMHATSSITNKKISWQSMKSGTTSALQAIWGSDPGNIYAVGSDGTVIYYNGTGLDWKTVMPRSDRTWSVVWGSGPRDVYVVGASTGNETTPIMHFDGDRWQPMDSGTTQAIHAVWGSGPDDVYAVGDDGLLLHNDGEGWLLTRQIVAAKFFGIAGDPAGRTRFIVGEQGTILRMTSPQ